MLTNEKSCDKIITSLGERHGPGKLNNIERNKDPCNSEVSKDTEEIIFLRNKLDLSLKDLGFNA